MDDRTRQIVERVLEGFQSMNIAIQEAGGTIQPMDGLRDMSGLDLVIVLSQNHIRMKFEKPTE